MSSFLEICQMAREECGMGGSGPTNTVGQTGTLATVVRRTSQAWIDIQKSRPYWKFLRAQFGVALTVDQPIYEVAAATDADPPGFGLTSVDKWNRELLYTFAPDTDFTSPSIDRTQWTYLPYQNWRH